MSDEEGIKQEGTGNVFDFAVETKAGFNTSLGYKLNIEKLEPETGYEKLEDSQVKIYLTDTNDNKIIGPLKISQLENYNLYEDVNIHSKENNVQVDKYRIRVWIDSEVDASSWDENTKLEYKFKIGVGASENQGKYTVTYNANGGEGKMAPSVYEGSTEEVLRKNTYTRGGYTFKGWSTTKDGEVEYQDQNTATTLTQDENNKNQTLYAVWNPNTYTVKYHPNGGLIKNIQTIEPDINYDPINIEAQNTKWTKEGNIYKSGNLSTSNITYLFHSITLEEAGTLSFEVAVSQSESYDELLFIIFSSDFSNLIENKTIQATPGITNEENLVYQKIETPLAAGSYNIIFGKEGNVSESEGLDRAYVKNIKLDKGTADEPIEQSLTVGQNNKLKKNEYKKSHYTFKGWNTNKNETNIKYKDENDLTKLESKVKENEQIDLHAIWATEKYTVNVVVQNGTVDTATKQVEYNKNALFNLTPNMNNSSSFIKCTNNQKGKIENNVLTVSNVNADTTCTITLDTTSSTVLYNDGTLILNELSANRSENVSVHGEVTKEYEPMSDSDSYVMTSMDSQPWYSEQYLIKSVEIGSKISPVSTSHWFELLFNMEKGDFTNLDTSHVIIMSYMFRSSDDFGSPKTYKLIGLEDWHVSNVTDMSNMFNFAGYSATTFNLDLSNWNTSKVIDMEDMFSYAGSNATTWSVKIPSKTGGLTNTTDKWYGSSESVYASPDTGKSFTLS